MIDSYILWEIFCIVSCPLPESWPTSNCFILSRKTDQQRNIYRVVANNMNSSFEQNIWTIDFYLEGMIVINSFYEIYSIIALSIKFIYVGTSLIKGIELERVIYRN